MTDHKKKLCLIYNLAPKYREGIYRLIDGAYDCHWVFGENDRDIKGMDLAMLKDATEVKNCRLHGHWYWQRGVVSLLRKYDTFFMLGELFCLSTWVLALLAKCSRKKKVYFWSHGWYGREDLVKRIIKKVFFHLADGTFLYGNYARGLMLKEGFSEERLFVIHNSLNYDAQLPLRRLLQFSDIYRQHFQNAHPTLIFIGRLTQVKRLDLVIDAVAALKEKGQDYNVVFVGDGEKKEALMRQAAGQGIAAWFYGACYDEAENAELIYNADLCVAPGNVGLTAIHTMMFGTPVLTHNAFAHQMPEFEAIREGQTGTFFDYGSADSLAAAIGRWFAENGDKREAIRRACYNEIDAYWTPQYQMDVIKAHLN